MVPSTLRTYCLSVAMVTTFAWSAAAAEFAGGTGEPADPYRIATVEQLLSIGDDPNLLGRHYLLINDLDLDPDLPGGRVFDGAVIAHDGQPDAAPYPSFFGRFYGDGHVIRNLTIRTETLQYLGLFGAVGAAGRIYDLRVENASIEGPGRIGILAGSSEGSIVNCHVDGTIRTADESNWVGGLVGTNARGISDCHAAVTLTAGDRSFQLGGLVGVHRGRIVNSRATGDIAGGRTSFDLGGLAGACIGGSIENSHATGHVTALKGSWSLGGLAGSADSGAWVVFCRAAGSVTGSDACRDLGGLVGHLRGEASNGYATGSVTAGDDSYNLGGLLGSLLGGTVSNGYAAGPIAGGSGSRSLGGLIGRIHTGGSVANCYATGPLMQAGVPHGRGGLIGAVDGTQRIDVARSFWDRQASGASQSAAGVGLTTEQMHDVETFRTARWDLAGARSDGTANIWRMPVDGGYPQLTAFDDPNDLHALEGTGTSHDPYRIATPEDLGAVGRYSRYAWYRLVADIDMGGITWARAPIPVLRGYFNGNGRRITNLTIEGTDTNDCGLFGRIESGAGGYDRGLDDVSIVAADSITNVGGVAGTNTGYVVGCYVTGTIAAGSGGLAVGGIAGSNRQGIVADSYATAVVSAIAAETRVGGLVGFNYTGTVSGCYATGRVMNADAGRYAGPLVGRDLQFSRIAASYFLAPAVGVPDNGLGIPLTDGQMRRQASFVGWNFTRTWAICEDHTYPRRRWEPSPCDP